MLEKEKGAVAGYCGRVLHAGGEDAREKSKPKATEEAVEGVDRAICSSRRHGT